MSKKGSFSREESAPSWVGDYVENLKKVSVRSLEEDRSFFDQISSVLGTKSKFSTVEDAVKDYQERTGLTQYLRQIQSEMGDVDNVKRAFDSFLKTKQDSNSLPDLLTRNPKIKQTIENFINSRYGYTSIEAVLQKLNELHKQDGMESRDLEDPRLKEYISGVITEVRKKFPQHEVNHAQLGKLDQQSADTNSSDSNTDAFSILMPAKY